MQLHDLMAKLFELRQVAADQAKDGPSGSGAMARALTAYEWLGDNIEAFVAGLDPEMTEGPASQTEGMGGDAGLVDRLREVYGQITPGAIERADLDGMAFTVKDAIAALTPPETAEAVPVAAEEGVVSVNEYAASYYFATDDGDYSPVEGERAMIEDAINGYLASHPAPEVARLREELAEANERADANAHGGFVWMERAEAAESKLADAVKALETAREALKPFSDYADPLRTAYPDDMPMTKGSAIAARQVTAGDFRRARAAYHAAARSASSQGGAA